MRTLGERGRPAAVVALVLLLASALLVACSPSGSSPSASEATDEVPPGDGPNIVLISTDDMSLAEMRYLPKTRRLLGGGGATFENFYAPQPLCCPSRAQLLTGQYAQNNGVRHNDGPLGGYQAFHPETALPVWLQEAGYATGMVGKYLNGYGRKTVVAAARGELPDREASDQELGWDHWDPTVAGVYSYTRYQQWNDGDLVAPKQYHTDYVAGRSEELVEEMAGGDRPFFLWSSFVAPHGVCAAEDEAGGCDLPPVPAPRDRGSERGEPVITTGLPSFNEADASDKPGIIRRQKKVSLRDARVLQQRRAESLAAVDEAVAGIVRSVVRAGELDDTVIAFTSDNGYLVGQHRWVGKVLAYDEAVRVPLLIRGPGIRPGVREQQTAAMIDLAPTFAALADARPQVKVDGRPIVLRPRRANRPDDRSLLLQAGVTNVDRYPGGWFFRGVRTGRYTYVRWNLGGFEELYDRNRDRYEQRSVADDPRYRRVRAELVRRTRALGRCAGTSCRVDFGPAPDPQRPQRPQRPGRGR